MAEEFSPPLKYDISPMREACQTSPVQSKVNLGITMARCNFIFPKTAELPKCSPAPSAVVGG